MIYCFDLDGTICSKVEKSEYHLAKPNNVAVKEINRLYSNGDKIIIMTARGSVSKKDYTDLTKRQLKEWGVNYHELIMNAKPHADLFIDDRAINVNDWLFYIPETRGIIAGAFDLIHPGYISMFEEAKQNCTYLTVALHADPSFENNKLKPVHTLKERRKILSAIKYVDTITVYHTEEELSYIIFGGGYDVRFLGIDYKDKDYTAKESSIPIHWIDRTHGYSTTELKRKVAKSLGEKND